MNDFELNAHAHARAEEVRRAAARVRRPRLPGPDPEVFLRCLARTYLRTTALTRGRS